MHLKSSACRFDGALLLTCLIIAVPLGVRTWPHSSPSPTWRAKGRGGRLALAVSGNNMTSRLYDCTRRLLDSAGIPVQYGTLGVEELGEMLDHDQASSSGPGGIEGKSSQEKNPGRSKSECALAKKFLVRLGVGLLSNGGSAPRAEYLLEKSADALHINVHLAVFQSLIVVVFPDTEDERGETCMLTVDRDGNVDKLQRLDELAIRVSVGEIPVSAAYWQLRAMVTSPAAFGSSRWQILSYGLSSFAAAPLFYSGNMWDGLISMVLGLGVGTLSELAAETRALNLVIEFVAALMVAIVARVCSVYLPTFKLCFFAICISSLVWLLPGEELTIGISEIVEESPITGTARVMKGLISTVQLGFGMAIGHSLVWWEKSPLQKNCGSSNVSPYWNIICFLSFAIAINLLLKGRLSQWPGMVLAAGMGILVDSVTSKKLGSEASAAFASFGIGLTGALLSHWTRDIPLTMILVGVQVVLPGQIGVQGVASFLDDDESVPSVNFVLTTVMICLSITIGLLLSKIAVQDGLLGMTKSFAHSKEILAKKLVNVDDVNDIEGDEDERVAI